MTSADRRWTNVMAGGALALWVGTGVLAQSTQNAGDVSDLRMVPVQGSVSMLAGPAGNVAVQTGKDGVLLVDTMTEALAPRMLDRLKALSPLPIRFVINTSMDADHVGGNAALAPKGATGSRPVPGGGATVIAHERVVQRLARPTASLQPGLPNNEYFTPSKDLYFNGEPIFIIHAPNAHTDGDSLVLFRRSDVIATGDIFTPQQYPVIDPERGGTVRGLIEALNRILLLAVPERLQDGGTRIIPGHGRVCNEADVVEYRDMVVIVRDRVRSMMGKGLSVEQIKAARPTLDYDGQYGDGARFVEAVVASLRSQK